MGSCVARARSGTARLRPLCAEEQKTRALEAGAQALLQAVRTLEE
jgi:hypothetical protein